MPHVTVKLLAGRSEELKTKLAEAVAQAVMDTLGSEEKSVSVALEEFTSGDWTEKVYKPDIIGGPGKLYKKPGYDPR